MYSMGKITSCQIAFTPIISEDYIADVNKVLDIIKSYELEYNVDILSTTVRGDKDRILEMITDIYNEMCEICSFTMDIKISNLCGCDIR